MDTKICVITGANSGIGKEAARLIAKEKVHVVMACRSKERAENAMHDILQADVSASLEIMMLDMSRKASIEAFAQAFSKKYKKLDILIHNAADFDISRKEPTYTEDSIESVWAINHIGCVLLTERLMPCLANSTNGRIITISSKGLAMLRLQKSISTIANSSIKDIVCQKPTINRSLPKRCLRYGSQKAWEKAR